MEAVRESGAGETPSPDEPSPSDRELVAQICAGSQEAAVTLLTQRYGYLLQRFSREYDEDIVSELYLHLYSGANWEKLRKWDGSFRFSGWLGAVARNLFLERMRSRGREAENLRKFASSRARFREDERAERDQPAVAIAEREDQAIRRSLILRALKSLSERDRLIISLLDLKVPPERIELVADMLALAVKAVRVAHTRAKKRFRLALEQEGGESDD